DCTPAKALPRGQCQRVLRSAAAMSLTTCRRRRACRESRGLARGAASKPRQSSSKNVAETIVAELATISSALWDAASKTNALTD
ncbi:MAG TPA: hypothetical protein VF395_09015, partial [Polyangiaceae bacterium]